VTDLRDPDAPIGPAAPAPNEADFRRIAAVLRRESGVCLPPGNTSLVGARLAGRLRALGLATYHDYGELILSDEGERREMISALTTKATSFFREPHHFDDLAAQVRGRWADVARGGGRVRLWSAGCSSGEEPCSIALALLAQMPDAPRHDVRILATDIDPHILEQARAGVYPAEALEVAPASARERWMEPCDGGYRLAPDARALITFDELNLIADWPMRDRFQAIFCRNVAIYFDGSTQERLWGRFADRLTPDGRLYIGYAERTADPRLRALGTTVYARDEAST
jgi:chemotaxis protein methyltransferase CheR